MHRPRESENLIIDEEGFCKGKTSGAGICCLYLQFFECVRHHKLYRALRSSRTVQRACSRIIYLTSSLISKESVGL